MCIVNAMYALPLLNVPSFLSSISQPNKIDVGHHVPAARVLSFQTLVKAATQTNVDSVILSFRAETFRNC